MDMQSDDVVSLLNKKISELSAENEKLLSENNRLLFENNRLVTENNRLISYNNDYIRGKYRLMDEINNLRQFKEDVLSSNSWKLTGFFRALMKKLH